MRFHFFIFSFFAFWFRQNCYSQAVDIIPKPAEVVFKPGYFNFEKGIVIKIKGNELTNTSIMEQFAAALFKDTNFKAPATSSGAKNIILELLPLTKNDTIKEETYRIKIAPDSFVIQSYTQSGLFYGCQSAIQLLHHAVLTNQIPCMEINDYPRLKWRGMHLDVSRHFFPKEVIKEYLDLLAKLKMNVFHWHLTDDQGWRIEIKKYPKLTEVGAWRTEKDGTKYGGFYTQEDIQEIVSYAGERFIAIVPEIEMPGHSSAAIAAYPELSCPKNNIRVSNTWGIKKDIFCPTDFTFQFLKNVLDEVCELFPGKYIHLGGDEVPKEQWKKSETVQSLMKKENLKNQEELQHYFMKKMEDYVAAKGKRAIGWGEIIKGGLSDSVMVMSWLDKNAGIKAAKHANRVIMAPRFFCYFDYPQKIGDKKNAWWMTYLPLKKVYRFNPVPKKLSGEMQKLIVGGQANVWTEYITNESTLRHQIMPRLAAMAEALWLKPEAKDFGNFKLRAEKINIR